MTREPYAVATRDAVVLVVALLLGLQGLTAPGNAETVQGASGGNAERAADAHRRGAGAGGADVDGPARRSDAAAEAESAGLGSCFGIAEGTVRDFETDPQEPADESRADLIDQCVRYGPTLAVTAQVVQPTAPEEDGNWHGATFVGWFVDTTSDGEGDYFIDFSLDADTGELTGEVRAVDDGEPGEVVCTAKASVARGVYTVSSIDPACFDDADEIAVNVAMFYDTTPEDGDGGSVYVDTHPADGGFSPEIAQESRSTDRLGGASRIDTAVEISRREFPIDANRVYLARAEVFADAVAGGTVPDGPILLVPSSGETPGVVRTEIDRLDPDEVVAFGGSAAIAEETHASAAGGRSTDRYAGASRIHTAVAISQNAFPGGAEEVYLARADVFADAVVGGSLADGPILLVHRDADVAEEVRAEIDRVDPDRVIALGGTAAVAQTVLEDAAGTRDTHRLAGAGRIDTSVEIARYAFARGAEDVFLARADLFADAVAGGVLSAGPTVLVPNDGDLPPLVAADISRLSPPQATALGGTAAVGQQVLRQAGDS